MISSIFQLALVACLPIMTQAFEAITVPAAIVAGQAFNMTVTTNDSDSAYAYYRVYLDTTPPGYSGGPSCYLENSTFISITSLTLTVPKNFGPDGSYYSVATREFPPADSALYTYSSYFNLTGATGNWSAYEDALNGSPLWPADDLPCAAYNCARKCAMSSYPSDLTADSASQTTVKNCIMACPSVSADTSTSSSSSSSSSTASATGSSAKETASGSGSASVNSATSTTDGGSDTSLAAVATSTSSSGSALGVSLLMIAFGYLSTFIV